jgi:hypothetical protein
VKAPELTPAPDDSVSHEATQETMFGNSDISQEETINEDIGVIEVGISESDIQSNLQPPFYTQLGQEIQARSKNTPEFQKNLTNVPALAQYNLGKLLPRIIANTDHLPPLFPTPVTSEHGVLYFRHFHHHWPLIHQPGYQEEKSEYILTGSVRMMGAWLEGTGASRESALMIHGKFFGPLLAQLVSRHYCFTGQQLTCRVRQPALIIFQGHGQWHYSKLVC